MLSKENFCAFILTHGRPDTVYTYDTIRRHGYTGKIVLIIDNEDKRADEYYVKYPGEVVMFDKKEIAKTFDEADNFGNRKTIVYARNACFQISKDLGYKYFIQLDDDYTSFMYRTPELSKPIWNLDSVFNIMLTFFKNTPIKTICFSQGGDHIGGYKPHIKMKRKAMNSFICSVDRPINFLGRINEDVNSYTYLGSIGNIFFTLMNVQLIQKNTQQNKGGMSDVYLDSGTYIKSFYSIIFKPSSVKIRVMGVSSKRLHHNITWRNTVPKIIEEKWKK